MYEIDDLSPFRGIVRACILGLILWAAFITTVRGVGYKIADVLQPVGARER